MLALKLFTLAAAFAAPPTPAEQGVVGGSGTPPSAPGHSDGALVPPPPSATTGVKPPDQEGMGHVGSGQIKRGPVGPKNPPKIPPPATDESK